MLLCNCKISGDVVGDFLLSFFSPSRSLDRRGMEGIVDGGAAERWTRGRGCVFVVGDKEQEESDEEVGHSHVEGGCHVSAIGEGALRMMERAEDCVGQRPGEGFEFEVEELEEIVVGGEFVELGACQWFSFVFEHDVEDVESSFVRVARGFASETAGR